MRLAYQNWLGLQLLCQNNQPLLTCGGSKTTLQMISNWKHCYRYGFTKEISLKLGLEKCKKATLTRGIRFKRGKIMIEETNEISELDQSQTYIYLGMNEETTCKNESENTVDELD